MVLDTPKTADQVRPLLRISTAKKLRSESLFGRHV
jgi:hypothetical protein